MTNLPRLHGRRLWFGTTGSKSRVNFLDLLRAGHTDYVVNDAALDYMRSHALAGPLASDWPRMSNASLPMTNPGWTILSATLPLASGGAWPAWPCR
jgi:hypothetical protein